MRLLLGLLLAVGLATPNNVFAQEDRIDRILQVFSESCGRFAMRTNELRSYLAKDHWRASPEEEKRILASGRGQIWRGSSDTDELYFLSYDDGSCAMATANVPTERLREAFRLLVIATGQIGQFDVKLRSDNLENDGEGQTHTLSFLLGKPGIRQAMQFELITVEKGDKNLVQLSAAGVDSTK